jgi:hypothetical protein
MEITIKSRSRKQINSKFLVCHKDSREAYDFYLNHEKQFQSNRLPNDIKNIILSFSNISVIKSENPKYYLIISGWRYAELIFDANKKIHVSVINDELSAEKIQLISWVDVLENLLSSWKHKFVLAQSVELMKKMPENIYALINSELNKKSKKALIGNLSQETREVIGRQIKNLDLHNKNKDKDKKFNSLQGLNSVENQETNNDKSILSQLINSVDS